MQHASQQPAARRALLKRSLHTVAVAVQETVRGGIRRCFAPLVPALSASPCSWTLSWQPADCLPVPLHRDSIMVGGMPEPCHRAAVLEVEKARWTTQALDSSAASAADAKEAARLQPASSPDIGTAMVAAAAAARQQRAAADADAAMAALLVGAPIITPHCLSTQVRSTDVYAAHGASLTLRTIICMATCNDPLSPMLQSNSPVAAPPASYVSASQASSPVALMLHHAPSVLGQTCKCGANYTSQAEEQVKVPAAAPSKAALKRARKKAAAATATAGSAAAAAAMSEPATEGAAGSLTDAAAHGVAQQPISAAAAAPNGMAPAQRSMEMLRLQDSQAVSTVSAGARAPAWMVCPLSHAVLADPVVCTGDGQTYERSAITQWLAASDTSPVTGQPLVSHDLLPNHALRSIIQAAQARSL